MKGSESGLQKFHNVILSTGRGCTGEDAAFKSSMVADKMGTDCDEAFNLLFS